MVVLKGKWDLLGSQEAEVPLTAASAGCKTPLVMDLAEVSMLVSLGIRQILGIAKAYHRNQVPFIIYRPSPRVLEILELANLGPILTLADSWEKVSAHLGLEES